MALECQQPRETSSSKISATDLDKGSVVASTVSRFNSSRETGKLIVHAPTTKSVSLKASSLVEPTCTGGRSITDLPAALISEILQRLEPKELGLVSCVSSALHRIASDHHRWKDFYCKRWGPPLGVPSETPWKEIFVQREFRSKVFMGRHSINVLYGHTEAVRSVFLLPFGKLIFTGGYDSVIRVWNMEEGLLMVSSRPLGCTIRALAADTELLVAGGTDGFIQCWRATRGLPHLFDVTNSLNSYPEFRLWEHEGPVTCLSLDSFRIYSGSWDMSVRVWDRATMKCMQILRHGDWVWSLVPCGSTVATSSGRDVYMWNISDGIKVSLIKNVHVGKVYALAQSRCGDLLFTGGEDGEIHMYKVFRVAGSDDATLAATWAPHTGPVYSLAFEFPWLVSSSADGKLALIDVRKLLRSSTPATSRCHARLTFWSSPACVEPPQRMLHGYGQNLFSVGIGADRIVCGGEQGVVRIWNFSQALEIESRIKALKGIRRENRRRRKVQAEENKHRKADQCSVAAKMNQFSEGRNAIWDSKRGVSEKLKA